MKIKPIASNMTELVLNDGTVVLFSYETPVASITPDGARYSVSSILGALRGI